MSVILSFCSQGEGVLLHCMLGYTPFPWDQRQTPLPETKDRLFGPKSRSPPDIRSMSRRYAFYWNAFLITRMHSSRMCTGHCNSPLLGGVCLGGVCLGGCLPGGSVCQEGFCQTPPPVNRSTDASENITLPQLLCGR